MVAVWQPPFGWNAANDVQRLQQLSNTTPGLAVVVVGERNPASAVYVQNRRLYRHNLLFCT